MEPWRADVGLCIPVLNERESLGPLLDDIAARLEGARWTVCIVDDGSRDGTRELIRERMARDPRVTLLERTKSGPGCRRGGASRAGIRWLLSHTTHAVLVDVDADGSNRPVEIEAGARRASAGDVDVVIASKYVAGSRVTGRPLVRRLGSRAYSLLLRAMMDPRIHDYSNSYRFYTRAAAELLFAVEPRYDTPVYLVEMIAIWLSRGLRFAELPTEYNERRSGTSKVIPGDFVRGFAGALRVGLRYRTGGYVASASSAK